MVGINESGKMIWDINGTPQTPAVMGANLTCYVSDFVLQVIALNCTNGTKLWSWNNNGTLQNFSLPSVNHNR